MVQLQNDLQALQPFGQYRKRAMGTFWDVNNKVELLSFFSFHSFACLFLSVPFICLSVPFPPP